jgi:hypothetical protein
VDVAAQQSAGEIVLADDVGAVVSSSARLEETVASIFERRISGS